MEVTDQMLTETESLQRALYEDWQRDDGSQSPAPFCKFCRAGNHRSHVEYHKPNCPRLAYLHHYYGVVPREPKNPRRRGLAVVSGSEFSRSGVHGWWQTKKEWQPLIDRAFAIERANDRGEV